MLLKNSISAGDRHSAAESEEYIVTSGFSRFSLVAGVLESGKMEYVGENDCRHLKA
jgi:hypothetical protein